eukprot:COSAG01_NODE_33558_length_562_cov_0.892009_1_plen_71_part_10
MSSQSPHSTSSAAAALLHLACRLRLGLEHRLRRHACLAPPTTTAAARTNAGAIAADAVLAQRRHGCGPPLR